MGEQRKLPEASYIEINDEFVGKYGDNSYLYLYTMLTKRYRVNNIGKSVTLNLGCNLNNIQNTQFTNGDYKHHNYRHQKSVNRPVVRSTRRGLRIAQPC